MFEPMLTDKNSKIKNNESEICKECEGKCCKRMGCEISPRDLKDYPNLTRESIIQLLETGYVSIDYCENFGYPEYSLRMRNKNSKIVDMSWIGECIALTKNGCKFNFENRPLGGRALEPTKDKQSPCSPNYGRKESKIEWSKYRDILDNIVNSIKCGDLKINYDSKYDEIELCDTSDMENFANMFPMLASLIKKYTKI